MGGSVFPARGSAEGPLVSHAVLPSLLGKSLWLGDGFMEVWVRRLAVWLTSILSVSRTVLLWFGPLDTTQTIPQPCKSRGGLGGLEQGGQVLMALLLGGAWLARFPLLPVSLVGPGWRQVGRGWHGEGTGWHDLRLFLPGASASSTQWPSPAGSCNSKAKPARSSLWTG